jgi:hypothetical protein
MTLDAMSELSQTVSRAELKMLEKVTLDYRKTWLSYLGLRPPFVTETRHYFNVLLAVEFDGERFCLCSRINEREKILESCHTTLAQAKVAAREVWEIETEKWIDI